MGINRITKAVATLSWIDPARYQSKTEPRKVPTMLTREGLFGVNDDFFGFCNFLEAWIDLDESNTVTGCGFTTDSGMYQTSFLNSGLEQERIGRKTIRNSQSVLFRQVAGCRATASEFVPERIAATVGYAAAAYISGRAGCAVAGDSEVLPPIWTELELAIHASGDFNCKLVRHSLVPSVCCFVPLPTPQASWLELYRCASRYTPAPALAEWESQRRGLSAGPQGLWTGPWQPPAYGQAHAHH